MIATAWLIVSMMASPLPERYVDAIALVESGGDPRAVGRHGELTQFQVLPRVWREHCQRPLHRCGPNEVAGWGAPNPDDTNRCVQPAARTEADGGRGVFAVAQAVACSVAQAGRARAGGPVRTPGGGGAMRKMTQQQIAEWNETFPPGSPCWVRYDDGSEHTHHTRSAAWLLRSGHAVVKVDGLSGGYSLDRLKMAETHAA